MNIQRSFSQFFFVCAISAPLTTYGGASSGQGEYALSPSPNIIPITAGASTFKSTFTSAPTLTSTSKYVLTAFIKCFNVENKM